MADTVTSIVIEDSTTHHIIHLTNTSDGTGEAAVTKVDKSAIAVATDGAEPASLDIDQIDWNIQGFTYVKILWDHTTDDLAMILNGNGYKDFRYGVDDKHKTKGLCDPRSAGDTGDIKLTTTGAASGATYDITIWLKKKAV